MRTGVSNGTASEVVARVALLRPRTADSLWFEAWRRFRRHRLAMVGAAVLTAMVVAVILGPLAYRVPIDELDFKAKLKGPSRARAFGTDDLARAILARMLYAGP